MMANEIQAQAASGLTLYAVLTNTTGQIARGTTLETIAAGSWTSYDIALTEATAGLYFGTMPSVAAGVYTAIVYQQAGASPATTDTLLDTQSIDWAGTSVSTPSTTTRYATVAELKTRLGISDATDDTVLGMVLDGVSRQIDNHCRRQFFQSDAGTVRYFTAMMADECLIDDISTLTELATDEDGDRTYSATWAATDYDLWPYNAAERSEPYTALQAAVDGDYSFPRYRKGVKIIGTWGWPAVPAPVIEACLIQGARVFKRKDSPFGVAGSPEVGEMRFIPRLDPDVRQLLEPYMMPTVV